MEILNVYDHIQLLSKYTKKYLKLCFLKKSFDISMQNDVQNEKKDLSE